MNHSEPESPRTPVARAGFPVPCAVVAGRPAADDDSCRNLHVLNGNIENSQDKNILAAAGLYDVDPALIKAVVWKESRFKPDGAGGLVR